MSLTTRILDLATRIGLEIKDLKVTVDNKEPIIVTKLSAFNKNFGTTAGTVAEGNDSRILNGQTAFSWGNHAGLYPSLTGTGASGTWGINISGTSYNSTLWNGYNMSVASTDVAPTGILGYYNSGVTFRRSSATALSSFLGLGSNAYTSTVIPTNTNQLTNGSGYITDISGKVDKVAGKSLIADSEITRLSTVVNQDISNKANKDGTNATGTWGINISGNAQSATNWGGRPADLNAIQTDFDLVLTRGRADAVTRLTPLPQFKNWLGLGSNAYSSTAYLPLINTYIGLSAIRVYANYSGNSPGFELANSVGETTIALNGNLGRANFTGTIEAAPATSNAQVPTLGQVKSNFVKMMDGQRDATDLNSRLTSGFYNAENTPTNAPGNYGNLIVAKGIDTGLQIYGGYNNDNLWFRGWYSGGGEFTPWRSVYHSGNFNPGNYLPLTGGAVSGPLILSSQLTINSSGVVTTMGALNNSWNHMNTSASNGWYFYNNINIAGGTTVSSGYVTSAVFNGALNGNATTSSSSFFANQSAVLKHLDGPRTLSDRNPNWLAQSVAFDFINTGSVSGATGNYCGVMTLVPFNGATASTGDSSYQLAYINETGYNGAGEPGLKLRKGIDTTWGSWRAILTSGNVSTYALPITGGTATGMLSASALGVSQTNGAGAGLSLYGGAQSGFPSYGITFSTTANYGTHGAVNTDWATYFTMDGAAGRGWIFRSTNSVNVASISNQGNATFNGTVTATDFIGISDIRLKENISILKPKPIGSIYKTYNFISDDKKQSRVGVIAQELELTNPEFVRTDSEGMKSISYQDLHSAEIAYLKAEVKRLSNLIKA